MCHWVKPLKPPSGVAWCRACAARLIENNTQNAGLTAQAFFAFGDMVGERLHCICYQKHAIHLRQKARKIIAFQHRGKIANQDLWI